MDIFRGQIVDVTSSVYTVQLAGDSEKLDGFIQAVGTWVFWLFALVYLGIAWGERCSACGGPPKQIKNRPSRAITYIEVSHAGLLR